MCYSSSVKYDYKLKTVYTLCTKYMSYIVLQHTIIIMFREKGKCGACRLQPGVLSYLFINLCIYQANSTVCMVLHYADSL